MRELFLETRELADQTGTVRTYDYSILIGEMDVGGYSCESYGIKVAERGGAGIDPQCDVQRRPHRRAQRTAGAQRRDTGGS